MTIQNNQRAMLGYLLIQRVILFLALYEYLNRLLQDAVLQAGSYTYQYDANGNMSVRKKERRGQVLNLDVRDNEKKEGIKGTVVIK